jgi:hypothetical protein
MGWHVVSPAYGRDYKNKAEAEADFNGGKDFRGQSHLIGGMYCSVRDFKPGDKVEIRYARMTKLTVVTIK